MLSDAAGMACKSYLRYLVLMVISVLASARTSPMVDNHEASLPPRFRLLSTGGGGKENTGGDASNLHVSVPSPMISDSVPLASPMSYDGGGKNPVPPSDHFLPNPSPASLGRGGKMNMGWSASQSEDDGGNGKMKQDSMDQPTSMAIGLIPITPGGDSGSFQFGLGPIDFGFNFGWGGLMPGYVVGYSNQPETYVIVSPYSSPYPIPSPYLPPGAGYGTGQPIPSQGYAFPYPPALANSARLGSTASKLKND